MSEHNPKTCGCRYVGNDAWTCGHVDNELFEAPFNLAGELIDNGTTAEGEARIRALAEAEARRAQHLLDLDTLDKAPCDLPLNDAEQAALDREWQFEHSETAVV